MSFNIIDNLGIPMFQVDFNDPYHWIGNLGSTIDVRTHVGSLGAPLVVCMMDDNGRTTDMTTQDYVRYIEQLEKGIRRSIILEDLIND